jgi:hypothetical protein
MPRRALFVVFAFLVAVAGSVAAGCGSTKAGGSPSQEPAEAAAEASSSTGGDAGPADVVVEAAPYPAFVPTDIPQVVSRGGPVLALPKVYPIYFATDDPTFTAQITDFVTKVGATNYWNTIGSEYGVGSLVAETPIQLTAADNPSALYTDYEIQALLTEKLTAAADAGDPAFPTPDENTIFAFFFPSGVTISEYDEAIPEGGADDAAASSPESCSSFGGYHSYITLPNGVNVAYAVIPRCSSFDGFVGIDAVTAAASHELVEGTTDPYGTAYSSADPAHRYWSQLVGGGGEIGDMCAQTLESFTHFPDLPAYLVQRCWSNKAALTGGDPCVPIPSGDVYFNTFPVMPDILQVTGRGLDGGTTTVPTKGIQIAVDASATIELDLFSNVPTPEDWTLQAYDLNALSGVAGEPALLDFSFDKDKGSNGDKIHMTITVLTAGRRNTEPFLIYSTLGSSPTAPQNIWAGIVGN